MTISLCLTIHDRPASVSSRVAESFRKEGNLPDETVIVLDRPTPAAEDGARKAYDFLKPTWVTLSGPPGWSSPVTAWNAAFKAVTRDFLYCISSETIQEPGNLAEARRVLTEKPNQAIFGKAECSCGPQGTEVNWNGTAPGNLFTDSRHPRPLGFIQAFPRSALKPLKGGFDPAFSAGLWFDDDDFAFRLWNDARLDFLFTDRIRGTHFHHDRPVLTTQEGQQAIDRNRQTILRKHGCTNPIAAGLRKAVHYAPDSTAWLHL